MELSYTATVVGDWQPTTSAAAAAASADAVANHLGNSICVIDKVAESFTHRHRHTDTV